MLEILSSSPFCSVQDGGRDGWQRFGLPAAGPMDRFAFCAANLLVGNPQDAAAIEIGLGGLALRCQDDCLIALGGPGLTLRCDGVELPCWSSIYLPAGSLLEIERSGAGVWGYLAVYGGVQSDPVMGSRAAYRPAALGQFVHPGDCLPTAPQPRDLRLRAGAFLPPAERPPYALALDLRALPGPQQERFTAGALETFYSAAYRVSAASDRTGYRLEGPRLAHTAAGADVLSAGVTPGCVQVPASGQPLVLMADAPTSGGYTLIASLPALDRALLAQVPPDEGEVRFHQVTLAEAQARSQTQWRKLCDGLEQEYPALSWISS